MSATHAFSKIREKFQNRIQNRYGPVSDAQTKLYYSSQDKRE